MGVAYNIKKASDLISNFTKAVGKTGNNSNNKNNTGNNNNNYNYTPASQQPAQQTQPAQTTPYNYYAQRPQAYSSKYTPQLESIMQQIQNPGEFKYEFNGDNLFKYYADLYSQNGKQAMMDTMGKATGLTGGYGNTYAQQVGQQTYDEYMRPLYEVGMDLRNAAYQQRADELANQKDAYNMLLNADNMDYGRYRDDVGDWQADRELAAGYALQILANGQMPSDEMLAAAGISPEDAQRLMAQLAAGGGGGRGGNKEEEDEATDVKAEEQINSNMAGNRQIRQGTVDVETNAKASPGTAQKSRLTTMTDSQYNRLLQDLIEQGMIKVK